MGTQNFAGMRTLGRSGLSVGRLGLASSYGGTAKGFEKAFERGCNYFYWGSFRRNGMADAIRNLAPRNRDKMAVVLQTYARWAPFISWNVERGLKSLKLDYADVLLLGWYNSMPAENVMRAAL